jgi:hypothetical protein
MRIVVIEAEGEGVASALHQLTALFPAPSVELTALPAIEERPSVRPSVRTRAVPARAKAAPDRRTTDGADREARILALLKFRPLRIPEIADGLCEDKRQVKVMAQRLYPAMARLVKLKRVVKKGREYSAK